MPYPRNQDSWNNRGNGGGGGGGGWNDGQRSSDWNNQGPDGNDYGYNSGYNQGGNDFQGGHGGGNDFQGGHGGGNDFQAGHGGGNDFQGGHGGGNDFQSGYEGENDFQSGYEGGNDNHGGGNNNGQRGGGFHNDNFNNFSEKPQQNRKFRNRKPRKFNEESDFVEMEMMSDEQFAEMGGFADKPRSSGYADKSKSGGFADKPISGKGSQRQNTKNRNRAFNEEESRNDEDDNSGNRPSHSHDRDSPSSSHSSRKEDRSKDRSNPGNKRPMPSFGEAERLSRNETIPTKRSRDTDRSTDDSKRRSDDSRREKLPSSNRTVIQDESSHRESRDNFSHRESKDNRHEELAKSILNRIKGKEKSSNSPHRDQIKSLAAERSYDSPNRDELGRRIIDSNVSKIPKDYSKSQVKNDDGEKDDSFNPETGTWNDEPDDAAGDASDVSSDDDGLVPDAVNRRIIETKDADLNKSMTVTVSAESTNDDTILSYNENVEETRNFRDKIFGPGSSSATEGFALPKESLETASAEHVTMRKTKRTEEPKWMDAELQKMINKKKKAWGEWKRTGRELERAKYAREERECKRMIRNRKNAIEREERAQKEKDENRYSPSAPTTADVPGPENELSLSLKLFRGFTSDDSDRDTDVEAIANACMSAKFFDVSIPNTVVSQPARIFDVDIYETVVPPLRSLSAFCDPAVKDLPPATEASDELKALAEVMLSVKIANLPLDDYKEIVNFALEDTKSVPKKDLEFRDDNQCYSFNFYINDIHCAVGIGKAPHDAERAGYENFVRKVRYSDYIKLEKILKVSLFEVGERIGLYGNFEGAAGGSFRYDLLCREKKVRKDDLPVCTHCLEKGHIYRFCMRWQMENDGKVDDPIKLFQDGEKSTAPANVDLFSSPNVSAALPQLSAASAQPVSSFNLFSGPPPPGPPPGIQTMAPLGIQTMPPPSIQNWPPPGMHTMPPPSIQSMPPPNIHNIPSSFPKAQSIQSILNQRPTNVNPNLTPIATHPWPAPSSSLSAPPGVSAPVLSAPPGLFAPTPPGGSAQQLPLPNLITTSRAPPVKMIGYPCDDIHIQPPLQPGNTVLVVNGKSLDPVEDVSQATDTEKLLAEIMFTVKHRFHKCRGIANKYGSFQTAERLLYDSIFQHSGLVELKITPDSYRLTVNDVLIHEKQFVTQKVNDHEFFRVNFLESVTDKLRCCDYLRVIKNAQSMLLLAQKADNAAIMLFRYDVLCKPRPDPTADMKPTTPAPQLSSAIPFTEQVKLSPLRNLFESPNQTVVGSQPLQPVAQLNNSSNQSQNSRSVSPDSDPQKPSPIQTIFNARKDLKTGTHPGRILYTLTPSDKVPKPSTAPAQKMSEVPEEVTKQQQQQQHVPKRNSEGQTRLGNILSMIDKNKETESGPNAVSSKLTAQNIVANTASQSFTAWAAPQTANIPSSESSLNLTAYERIHGATPLMPLPTSTKNSQTSVPSIPSSTNLPNYTSVTSRFTPGQSTTSDTSTDVSSSGAAKGQAKVPSVLPLLPGNGNAPYYVGDDRPPTIFTDRDKRICTLMVMIKTVFQFLYNVPKFENRQESVLGGKYKKEELSQIVLKLIEDCNLTLEIERVINDTFTTNCMAWVMSLDKIQVDANKKEDKTVATFQMCRNLVLNMVRADYFKILCPPGMLRLFGNHTEAEPGSVRYDVVLDPSRLKTGRPKPSRFSSSVTTSQVVQITQPVMQISQPVVKSVTANAKPPASGGESSSAVQASQKVSMSATGSEVPNVANTLNASKSTSAAKPAAKPVAKPAAKPDAPTLRDLTTSRDAFPLFKCNLQGDIVIGDQNSSKALLMTTSLEQSMGRLLYEVKTKFFGIYRSAQEDTLESVLVEKFKDHLSPILMELVTRVKMDSIVEKAKKGNGWVFKISDVLVYETQYVQAVNPGSNMKIVMGQFHRRFLCEAVKSDYLKIVLKEGVSTLYLYQKASEAAKGAIRYDALCKERDKSSLSDRAKFRYVREKSSDEAEREKRDRKDSPLQYEKRSEKAVQKPSMATDSVRQLAKKIYEDQKDKEKEMKYQEELWDLDMRRRQRQDYEMREKAMRQQEEEWRRQQAIVDEHNNWSEGQWSEDYPGFQREIYESASDSNPKVYYDESADCNEGDDPEKPDETGGEGTSADSDKNNAQYGEGNQDNSQYPEGNQDYSQYPEGNQDYSQYQDGNHDYSQYRDSSHDYSQYRDSSKQDSNGVKGQQSGSSSDPYAYADPYSYSSYGTYSGIQPYGLNPTSFADAAEKIIKGQYSAQSTPKSTPPPPPPPVSSADAGSRDGEILQPPLQPTVEDSGPPVIKGGKNKERPAAPLECQVAEVMFTLKLKFQHILKALSGNISDSLLPNLKIKNATPDYENILKTALERESLNMGTNLKKCDKDRNPNAYIVETLIAEAMFSSEKINIHQLSDVKQKNYQKITGKILRSDYLLIEKEEGDTRFKLTLSEGQLSAPPNSFRYDSLCKTRRRRKGKGKGFNDQLKTFYASIDGEGESGQVPTSLPPMPKQSPKKVVPTSTPTSLSSSPKRAGPKPLMDASVIPLPTGRSGISSTRVSKISFHMPKSKVKR